MCVEICIESGNNDKKHHRGRRKEILPLPGQAKQRFPALFLHVHSDMQGVDPNFWNRNIFNLLLLVPSMVLGGAVWKNLSPTIFSLYRFFTVNLVRVYRKSAVFAMYWTVSHFSPEIFFTVKIFWFYSKPVFFYRKLSVTTVSA